MCITQYASPGGASQRHVLGNTRHREKPPSDAYWVIHVTGRNLRILTVNTNNWVWGFNLLNNNVNAMHLARTYWGIPSSSFEIGGQYHLPPSACGLRGSGWYWPPISQDSDGIPQYVLARCMAFTLLLCKLKPHTQLFVLTVKILRFLPVTCITQYASLGGASNKLSVGLQFT